MSKHSRYVGGTQVLYNYNYGYVPVVTGISEYGRRGISGISEYGRRVWILTRGRLLA